MRTIPHSRCSGQKGSSATKPFPPAIAVTTRLKLHNKVFNQHPTGQNPIAEAVQSGFSSAVPCRMANYQRPTAPVTIQ